jgi:hypothetical protein
MEKWMSGLFKKREPKYKSTLPCGICDQKIRARKYQSHWARCFLRQNNNKAKVKGGIISRHVKLKKEPEIGGGGGRTRDKYLYVNFPTLLQQAYQ